jgi:predicted lysophospholipase L1 biosynthesis ABC-type transport system permease subunit
MALLASNCGKMASMETWLGDRRQALSKLPLVTTIMILQIVAEYYIYGHLNATVAIIITPVIAWWLLVLVLRLHWPASSRLPSSPRLIASILTFGAWWVGGIVAANTFGT